jgi:hypothetical protein
MFQHNSAGMAMDYELNGYSSIPCKGNKLFYTPITSRLALGLTQLHTLWVSGDFSPGSKRLGCIADCSPPSSASVKRDGSMYSFLILFHGLVLNHSRSGTTLHIPSAKSPKEADNNLDMVQGVCYNEAK